ncbi:plasmid partitioning protein RepB C-terminal domain-containing protein [Acidovorax sp. T1]|uniref:plasmid partitioning protein RepB C-terminal domain-containing protein n=1 Tax=Acidovorax sp. T1 TaxID=1858609 RepID=UPI00214FBDE8|nr:plasmid partitioning protein RepB C-terminal domain-containing protein [Acidovorax sp. T1]
MTWPSGANALLYNTQSNMLVAQAAANDTISVESMAKMEREMAALQVQNKAVEETYGPDVLHLTVMKRFLEKWMDCAPIVRWLAENQPEYFREFQSIAGTTQIDSTLGGATSQQSRGKRA